MDGKSLGSQAERGFIHRIETEDVKIAVKLVKERQHSTRLKKEKLDAQNRHRTESFLLFSCCSLNVLFSLIVESND